MISRFAKSRAIVLRQFLMSTEFGGAADIALHLARDWRAERRTAVEAWIPGRGRAADAARSAGLPVVMYGLEHALSRSTWRSAYANAAMGVRLAVANAGIQHIHSPTIYGAMRRGLRCARGATVVHVHLDLDLNAESLRWAFQSPPDLIVTCARYMERPIRESMPKRLRDQQRIAVVPNAVNTERFAPGDRRAAKQKLGASLDRPLVLMLANLSPHKGQLTAIRAVAELLRRGANVECWLAGVDRTPGGPFRARLEAEIRELGLTSHVSLLGYRDDAPDLLRAADLLLLPSTSEGLPLTLLEAQASRVPVLAAPTAGIPEIIRDGETGFLVTADDPAAYAARMQEILSNVELRDRLVDAAYTQCLRAHCWSHYFDQMCDHYDELLSRPLPKQKNSLRAAPRRVAPATHELPALNRVSCDETVA